MKSPVICVILFFTRVCLLSALGPSTLLKHILAYSCTVFSYIYFTLSIGYQTADVRLNTSVVCTKGSPPSAYRHKRRKPQCSFPHCRESVTTTVVRLGRTLRLQFFKLVKSSLLCHKLLICTVFNAPSAVHNGNFIGIFYSR